MLKKVLACAVLVALSGCSDNTSSSATTNTQVKDQKAQSVTYPETKKGEVVDVYFDQKVADPYRWLEDDMSSDTADWVKTQNNLTFSYLENIPYRDKLKASLEKLMNYEKENCTVGKR